LLSIHFTNVGAPEQAIAAAQRALALAPASGDVILHAMAHFCLGFAYDEGQGDYRRAIACYRQTVASLEGARRSMPFGQLLPSTVISRANLAWCHAELGTFAEGAALGEEGLQIAEMGAGSTALIFAYWGMGLVSLRQGDLHKALPWLERAMRICQEADLPLWFPKVAVRLGAAYTLAGRLADAVPLLTQAMEQYAAMGRGRDEALCRLSLGEAQVRAGLLEEAQTLTERALALACAHQHQALQAYALRSLGEIHAQGKLPHIPEAETSYQQARTLADELGMRPLQAHCHLGLGTLYTKTGQREQARTALSTAIAMYRAMEMMFWLPQAETALAQVEGQ
jgi:tetratricopeptide (TPR) repeat protein